MTQTTDSDRAGRVYRHLTLEAAGVLQVKRLVLGALAASVATNVLLAATVLTTEPVVRTVVLAPGATTTYIAESDTVSENWLERFAVTSLSLVMNVQPTAGRWQIERFLEHVAPESYGAIAHQLTTGLKELERNQAATHFVMTATRVDAAAHRVCVKGEERTYIARTQTGAEPVTACVRFVVREGRLWIAQLEKTYGPEARKEAS